MKADHARLAASLSFNVVAKLPGIVAAFLILPMVSRALGPSQYGELLSALALGSVATLPFGGINAVGRRMLATAVGVGNKGQQADSFVSTICLAGFAATSVALVVTIATGTRWTTPTFLFISLLPILAGFLNTFDNLRAAFNEHYVTAAFQFLFQTTIYVATYYMGLSSGSILLSGLALQAPFTLASAATAVSLLRKRSFLAMGKLKHIRGMVGPSTAVLLADGAMMALLNLSVYYVRAAGDTEMSAWIGTLVRLFQALLSPVLLVALPITSYLSMRWPHIPHSKRRFLEKLFAAGGLGYGLLAGTAMAVAGPYYIDHMFTLRVHGSSLDLLALSLLVGAVVTQKTYALLVYAVSEARFFSFGTTIAALIGLLGAAMCSHRLTAVQTTDCLFIVSGTVLLALVIVDVCRNGRPRRLSDSAPPPGT